MIATAADTKKKEQYEAHKQKAAALRRAISAAGKEIGGIPSVFDPERKEACRRDLKLWLEEYCSEAVRLGWSADHLELIQALQDVLLYGGQLAIGMPRGTGKSTIVSLAILWAVLYGHHRFIALIAATDPKAKKLLTGIKRQVEVNQALLEDFPEVCYPVRCLGGITNRQAGQTCGGEPTLIAWGKEEIIFPTIEGSAASGAIVIVGGITGAITRGPQHTLASGEIIRPTVALLDDFQTRESARSMQQVQDRLDIIEADISGMAGPDSSMSLLCTVTVIYPGDGADQLLDLDKHPEWGGIRKKFVLSMPSKSAMKHWETYAELFRQSKRTYRDARIATAYYMEHREEMDDGCEVSWDKRFKAQQKEVDGETIDVGEVSAIQHAMNWFLIKPNAFASELQNDPSSGNVNAKGWLTAKQIEERTNALRRGQVPELLLETSKLIAHVDVHDNLHYFTVLAMSAEGSAAVIDYGTYPEQKRRYFQKDDKGLRTLRQAHQGLGRDGAIRHGLLRLIETLLQRVFVGEADNEYQVWKLAVDGGHNKQIVNSVLIELSQDSRYRGRLVMTKGFGVGAKDTPLAERKHKPGTRLGNHCYSPPRQNRNTEAPELYVDTNYWKTTTADRWATPEGEPGCLAMYRYTSGRTRDKADHQGFSEHQKAESATEVVAKGRTVWEWKKLPTDNHWLDTTVNALAVAAYEGCDTPANAAPAAPRRRKRRRVRVLT